jgi:hypothetical protein
MSSNATRTPSEAMNSPDLAVMSHLQRTSEKRIAKCNVKMESTRSELEKAPWLK